MKDHHKNNKNHPAGHGAKKKAVARKAPYVPSAWLYLAPEDGRLERLYELLKDEKTWRAEFWQEAEVLEIAIPEAGSMDMERLEPDPEDGVLLGCMERCGAERVYGVEFASESYDRAKKVMEYIVGHAGGLFCKDTEDLMPRVGESHSEPAG